MSVTRSITEATLAVLLLTIQCLLNVICYCEGSTALPAKIVPKHG